MPKPTYLVTVIRKGRERDYHDFWERGREQNDAGEPLSAELVGFVESVRARNPGHQLGTRIVKQARPERG